MEPAVPVIAARAWCVLRREVTGRPVSSVATGVPERSALSLLAAFAGLIGCAAYALRRPA